jgi:transcription-repair coupling factor (superfamily II helicase)
LKQAQQQESDAHAAAVNETAQAKAANNVQSNAETATAQALNLARAQLAMTADAVNFPSTQAAAIATADARSLLQVQQQAQTTATSQAMAAQQTAQAIEARATVDARAMLAAQQQSETTATAQAMQREGVSAQQAASTSKWQNELMAWLIPLLAVVAFGLTLLLAVMFFSGMLEATNTRRGLENQRLALLGTLYGTPHETIVYADGLPSRTTLRRLNSPGPVVVQPEPVILDGDVPASAVLLAYDDQVLEDHAEAREESARYKLAMKLIRDSINHLGADSNRIPESAQLNWPDGAWTIAVAILRPFGVEILPGEDGGTFLVGQYASLQALYNAIGVRMLDLLPPTV